MKYALIVPALLRANIWRFGGLALALLAGCVEPGDRPSPEPEPEFDRPRPGVADYQRLAGEIVDGVGALATMADVAEMGRFRPPR